MMSRILLGGVLIAGAACASAMTLTTNYQLLPPPQLLVTVEVVDVTGTRIEHGKQYWIYVSQDSKLGYVAVVTDQAGSPLYEDLPLRAENCHDSSLRWPDATVAHLKAGDDADSAALIAYARPLHPCVIVLDLPRVPTNPTSPGRPNPGLPDQD